MDPKIIGMTRRGFLVRLGAGALMAAGTASLTACEQLLVTAKIEGNLLEFLTPPGDETWFYQSGQRTTKEQTPDLNRSNWQASVTVEGGMSATLDFSVLESLSASELDFWKTIRCVIIPVSVGTPQTIFVANGLFTGVPLKDALEALVTIPEGIQRVRFTAADGFTTNIPLERIMNPAADQLPIMLAYEQNGEPLQRLRGAPVRVIMPETWGYKNIKWVSEIELVTS
ncbi:MAG: molybdopterin-dependent oxidoreductase, partial [Myxococcota bacterium]